MGNEPQRIYELFFIAIHFKEFIFPKTKKLQNCLIKNTASKHAKKKLQPYRESKEGNQKIGSSISLPITYFWHKNHLATCSFCTLLKEFVPEF